MLIFCCCCEGRVRVLREDYYGETRSELFIQKTGLADNGTYHCQAENKAARVVSNFTLHVTDAGASAPTILEVNS